MTDSVSTIQRILILFSDTGGGHRSAAEALREAWEVEHPGCVVSEMVDVFRGHTPFPFRDFGPIYPWLVRNAPWAYAGLYHATDSPGRAMALARTCYGMIRSGLRQLLRHHPADLLVSVHPLFNHCIPWALREEGRRTPLITVVTDLWTAHAFWYAPESTHIVVPTEGAYQRARECGVPARRLTIRGLPVARRFTHGLPRERKSCQAALGLEPDRPTALLIGGGDGMGPVEEVARAIDLATRDLAVPPQLVIITGRNSALRDRLTSYPWRIPVRVEGFVRNMPEWMAASDVLVTKAGPGTINEGLLSGLPIVLFGKVPGQEDGNVDYVVNHGVGVWAPHPQQVGATLRTWFSPGNEEIRRRGAVALSLVSPDAASDIAADILSFAQKKTLLSAVTT